MVIHKDEEQKKYEARLQRCLQILKQHFEAGKIKIAEGLNVVESLEKVRHAPDGSFDLDTVDGSVRSMALAVEFMHDRQELKQQISLAEIQESYFAFLDYNFGNFYKMMCERGLSPHDMGMSALKIPAMVTDLSNSVSSFMEVLEEFWSGVADAAHAHVEDMNVSMKSIFGGDLFPYCDDNIASKCCIYTDTLIMPDPFLRSKHIFASGTPEQRAYFMMKHGLNVLKYKELACADVPIPIVVILPDYTAVIQEERQFVQDLGKADALIHSSKVFGRSFDSLEDLVDFASELNTIEKVEAEVIGTDRVLFDTGWGSTVRSQIENALKDESTKFIDIKNPGIIVASQAVARMGIMNELLIKARRLRGTPIIDAPTSWQYFVWKLEYDAEGAAMKSNCPNLHVLHGLQSLAENQMEWLGKVPPDALIELRKVNALGEIRAILGKGIDELAQVNPTNFYRTSDQVFDNIRAAFVEHKTSIEQLRAKKWKFAGTDIGSWLVVGSLAVTSAATGLPVWGLAAVAADQLLSAPKLKDIPKSIKELAEESNKLKKSPVGMLFQYSQRKA
ncbi:MAG: hypothetical protein CVU73_12325 [Deltaproteobacteria bacterium HGW-Deltaproteobacteria-8]|jgi:hypothetical protein|nr:MAG: hypothetical protein CVU73_12325 [Deltaproteobacteria bacterium HGW-Deltaproteobacteria-8]